MNTTYHTPTCLQRNIGTPCNCQPTEDPLQDGIAMSEFPEKVTNITLELKECLEYCMQQNGRDSCKNCGLCPDMLDHIHYLVGKEVEKARLEGYDEGAHESSMVCNEHTIPIAVKETIESERNAWLAGTRCHTCGNEMKSDGLSDTCSRCFEEN